MTHRTPRPAMRGHSGAPPNCSCPVCDRNRQLDVICGSFHPTDDERFCHQTINHAGKCF